MAGQVGKLTLEAVIKGFEDVQGLGKALALVEKGSRHTDKSISQLAQNIKVFAVQNVKTTDSIRGQIQAFTQLRKQVSVTSTEYRDLSSDIKKYNEQLKDQLGVEKKLETQRKFNRRTRADFTLSQRLNVLGTDRTGEPSKQAQRIKELDFALGELNAEQLEKLGLDKEISVQSDTYRKVVEALTDQTEKYSAAVNRQKAKAAEALAMDKQRFLLDQKRLELDNKRFKLFRPGMGLGMGSLGQISTSTEVAEGGIGPVQRDTRLQDKFKNQPWIARFLQSHIETSNWQKMMGEKRSMPLPLFTTPTSTFPSGEIYDPKSPKRIYGPEFKPAGTKFGSQETYLDGLKFPKTEAGFAGKIAELAQNIKNLTLNTDEYRDAKKELNAVEKEFDSLLKKSNETVQQASGKKINLSQKLLPPSKQSILEGQGKFTAPEVKKTAKSVEELAHQIKLATKAGNGNINSLTKQRTKLEQLRNGLDPASKSFQRITRDIQKTDQALTKLNSNKFSGRNLARTGQSVLGAAYFGGPAGLLGAGLGAGVEALRPGGDMAQGAVSGGLLASQIVSPVAQFVSGSATYASDIAKAQIALKKAAGDGDSYAKAMEAAQFAIDKLNVPQEIAIRGMTRLSAAVVGAGGNIDNAAEAFISITSAIKGTAGNSEDVKAAITAMVQIFSKGKVSAEELSGQLGERFPAAVVKFAEANKLNAEDLQKRLKEGTVGLDMLSKFVASLGKEFLPVALEIAGSSEEAGARMQIMFRKIRLEVGNSLKPAGAALQVLAARLVRDALPAIIEFAKKTGEILLGLVEALKRTIRFFQDWGDLLVTFASAAVAGKVIGAIQLLSFSKFALLRVVVKLKKAWVALNITMLNSPLFRIAAAVTAVGWAYTRAQRELKSFTNGVLDGTHSMEEADTKLAELKKGLEAIQKAEGMGIDPMDVWNKSGNLKKLKEINEELSFGRDQRITGGPAPQIIWGGLRAEELNDFITLIEDAKRAANGAAIDIEELWEQMFGDKAKFKGFTKGGGDEKFEGFMGGFKKWADEVKPLMEEIADVTASAFDKMADHLATFLTTGKLNFKEFARSVIADIARMIAKQLIFNTISAMGGGNFLSAIFGGGGQKTTTVAQVVGVTAAKGQAFARNGIVPYRKGGVVNRPTMFKYGGSQLGIMGEAGPEAILPLKRGRGGKLGVAMQGGGGGTTNVNYTGPTLNFNGDEYVPKSAVGGIINAAAKQGASMGQTSTMRSLQNNRSTRSRLGM